MKTEFNHMQDVMHYYLHHLTFKENDMKKFELTQEQINQLADKKHAKELLQKFIPEAFENKLEVGRWYKSELGSICFNLEDSYYGFDCVGYWRDITYFKIGEDIYEWELATEEEVSEALINEAKKRGFNNIGDLKIKNTVGSISNGFVTITNDFYYEYESNTLRLDGAIIFNNGKWAEIIEEVEPTKEEINRVLTFLKKQNEQ